VIVPGKRVCRLENPVDIVGEVLEEPFAITRFEIPKDLVNNRRWSTAAYSKRWTCAQLPRDNRLYAALSRFGPLRPSIVSDFLGMILVPTPHSPTQQWADEVSGLRIGKREHPLES